MTVSQLLRRHDCRVQPRRAVHRSESSASCAIGHVPPKKKQQKALRSAQRSRVDDLWESRGSEMIPRRNLVGSVHALQRIAMRTEALLVPIDLSNFRHPDGFELDIPSCDFVKLGPVPRQDPFPGARVAIAEAKEL